MRFLKDRVAMSTINLEMYQTVEYRSEPSTYKRSFWKDLGKSFRNGGEMLGLDAQDIGLPEGLGSRTRALEPAFASAGLPYVVVPVRSQEAAARARLDEAARRRAHHALLAVRASVLQLIGALQGLQLEDKSTRVRKTSTYIYKRAYSG